MKWIEPSAFRRFVASIRLAMCGACWVGFCSLCTAQVEQENLDAESKSWPWNIPTPTLGGMQLWTDYVHSGKYRIQRHALTRHFRLIDDRSIRRAWGSFEQCDRRLAELGGAELAAEAGKPILLLLHGLGRSRNSMSSLGSHAQSSLGYRLVNVSYASTRASLDDHAEALESILSRLPAGVPIDVVAHSLGNIVLRRYLYRIAESNGGCQSAARLRRIVMLAPPNRGSELARRLQQVGLVKQVLGASAAELAKLKSAEADEALRLATPQAEFGIIAGKGSFGPVGNPWLAAENDLIVEVDETRLAGASDFLVADVTHTRIMANPAVQAAVARFLEHGYFVAADKRQPIPAATENGSAAESNPLR